MHQDKQSASVIYYNRKIGMEPRGTRGFFLSPKSIERCFHINKKEEPMVILIIADGLVIFIYMDAYRQPVMKEECLWPPL